MLNNSGNISSPVPQKPKSVFKTNSLRLLNRGTYYPKTLPRERGSTSKLLNLIGIISLLGVSIYLAETDLSFISIAVTHASILPPIFIFAELLQRIFLALEEYQHILSLYDNNTEKMLCHVFHISIHFTLALVTTIVANFILYLLTHQYPWHLWTQIGSPSAITSVLAGRLLFDQISLKNAPIYDSLWMSRDNGLNYGSGMAHSFFHGYLEIVLPAKGTGQKGLQELIEDYEGRHSVLLDEKKLFLLIPKSCYCSSSLMSSSSPTIEESSSLEEIKQTVAGVQNRIYKNSVYKILPNKGKRVYVAAEYATPLRTFKKVIEGGGHHSGSYRTHKNTIVLQFYLTLKQILDKEESCRNHCELIYFDDKDSNGDTIDVGKVILQRLKELKKRQEKKHE